MAGSVFSQAPLAALIVGVIAAAIVCRRSATRSAARVRFTLTAARCLLFVACAAIVIEHLLLLLAPQAVLRWNADVRRLIVLEAVGALAGCACVTAALAALSRQLSGASSNNSIARTLNLSVASVVMVSGVTIAVTYRWASSWSVVTLTPYVLSLPTAQPRVDLVASTPFAVRLHVIGAFASIALLPFADTFAGCAARVAWSVGAIATRFSRARFAGAHFTVPADAGVRSKAMWFKGGR